MGGQQVLVIATHPDDEALGCAGTILQHVRSRDTVSIACITDGAKSRAGGLHPEQMSSRRKQEAEAAARSLRVNRFEWLGLSEGSWTYAQLNARLLGLLQEISPVIIYAPSRVDFHPEHHRVAHGLAQLLSGEGGILSNATVRIYQVQVPLTPVLTNLVTDCSSVSFDAATALGVYVSQSANLSRALRLRQYTAQFYGLSRQGEEFWQMPAAHYCRLHDDEPEHWTHACFRGIRYSPFSDPLAYISGLRARYRLKITLKGKYNTIDKGP
jgi:LmbE family N-acetylglucosaminyl deacetylase